MKLGNGILTKLIQNLSDENFHVYNSLVLTDDLAFQRTHFRITPPNIPRLYQHYADLMNKMTYPYKTDQTYKTTNYSK
jgi:hypothetical protein